MHSLIYLTALRPLLPKTKLCRCGRHGGAEPLRAFRRQSLQNVKASLCSSFGPYQVPYQVKMHRPRWYIYYREERHEWQGSVGERERGYGGGHQSIGKHRTLPRRFRQQTRFGSGSDGSFLKPILPRLSRHLSKRRTALIRAYPSDANTSTATAHHGAQVASRAV